MPTLLKDPMAALDYAVDWGADYLGQDTLAGSSWAVIPVEPGGVEIAGSTFDGRMATVTATGGVAGHIYQLTNHVALLSGRTDSRSIVLRIEKR